MQLDVLPQADWDIVERGWQAHILGEAPDTFTDAVDAIKAQRSKNGDPENPVSDQFLDPFVIVDAAGSPVGAVQVCYCIPHSAILHAIHASLLYWLHALAEELLHFSLA